MNTEPSSICIHESLDHLAELLHESCTGCEPQWVGKLNQHLEQLEQSLSAESFEPMASEFLKGMAQAHLRKATALLIDAVKRYQNLESVLIGEAI